MCGIAGIHLKECSHPTEFRLEDFVDALLLGIENRGKDATGLVAVGADGQIVLDKRDMRASMFVLNRDKLPLQARTVLLHARYTTQGHESRMVNNHPVVSKTTFVTHNGMIVNDYLLFKEFNLAQIGEVDSEIIAAMFAEFGLEEAKAISQELSGSFVYAVINPEDNPNEVVLVKYHNPLYILETSKMIVWASQREAIEDAWGLCIGTPPAANKFIYPRDCDILHIIGDTITRDRFSSSASTSSYADYEYYWINDDNENEYNWGSEDHNALDTGTEGDTCALPAIPDGTLPPGNWTRQADGSWKKRDEDGTVIVLYPTNNNRYVRAEIGAEGYEHCWICNDRAAVATIIDGHDDVTWKVPVCIPCLREDSDDGAAYHFAQRDAKQCYACGKGAGAFEKRFSWKRGKGGSRLCVRCYRTETRVEARATRTVPGPISPGEKPEQTCHYCGGNKDLNLDGLNHAACMDCRYEQCESCKVCVPMNKLEKSWAGILCRKCIVESDKGAWCAECRDWYDAEKLVLCSDGKARCRLCDQQYASSIATKALEHSAEEEEEKPDLEKYEKMAKDQRTIYNRLCYKVSSEMEINHEFVDWLLRFCPKAQFAHDKQLKALFDQAYKAYNFYLRSYKEEQKAKEKK